MNPLLSKVISNTYTKSDIYHRFALIREFVEFVVYKENRKSNPVLEELEHFLSQRSESQYTTQSLLSWGEDFWNSLISGDIDESLSELYKEIASIPVIVLYVPHTLPNQYIREIGELLREQTRSHLALDIQLSSLALGGCAFGFNGRLYNYSFRSRIPYFHDRIVDIVKEERLAV